VVRHRILILVITGVSVLLAAIVGIGVFGRLSSGGFNDPGSASTRAATLLADQFSASGPDVVVVVSTTDGSPVTSPTAAAAGAELTRRLAAEPGVTGVASYWQVKAPALLSGDGSAALITADLAGTDGEKEDAAALITADLNGVHGPLTVVVGGRSAVFDAVGSTIEHDLAKAESFAVPLTFLLLLFVFGTLVASGLPLVIGAVSVLGSFFVLWILTLFTEVSVFSINLVTGLGLGLAIDYALLMTTRFREELAAGYPVDAAVGRTIRTAGRTVVFSGLTVAAALSSLLVFPQFFLRSFAYAGIATTVLAILGAVVALPALLAVLGTRVNTLRVLRRPTEPAEDGPWSRLATTVMRRPVAYLIGGVTILVVLGLPFFGVRFGTTDDRVLPASAPAAQASQLLRDSFVGDDFGLVTVVAPDANAKDPAVADYASELSGLPGVVRVESSAGTFADGVSQAPATPLDATRTSERGGTWLTVVSQTDPHGPAGIDLVRNVRAVPSVLGATYVGGAAAEFSDNQDTLAARLPWALGIIATATFILLFLFTGSVVIPAKALVLNVLSLSATFGAMVWVFQQGHLQWLVGDFQVTGMLDTSMPILIFAIAFGLSMDYEVFLLSRIREEYDRTGDNTRAVAVGLQRTGRIMTAAALTLAVVFLAFVTSQVAIIKLMGLGIALAVIMDATLVRGILVPAFMRLAGDWNWWAPAPLRRLHDRIGLSEHDLPDERVAPERVALSV
jgi:RND superfamily putative drug exporter